MPKPDKPSTKSSDSGKPKPVAPPELSITVSGRAHDVRRTLHAMQFDDIWDPIVTRRIALAQTLVAGASLDDTLGGAKLAMFSQDVRDLYRTRCVNEASHRGHPVADPSSIPADEDTTVMEVGDALFTNSQH